METTRSRLIELNGSSTAVWSAALNQLPDAVIASGVWLHAFNAQNSDIFFYRNDIGELCESFSYFDISVDYSRIDVLRKVEDILFIYPSALLVLEDFCGFAAKQILFCARDGAFGAYYELWWNHAERFCPLRNAVACHQLRHELPLDILADMDCTSFQAMLSGAYLRSSSSQVALPEELID